MYYSKGQATFQSATQTGIPSAMLEIVKQVVLIYGRYKVIVLRRISDYGYITAYPLVAFYDTLGIRRTYSRLKPPASSRGSFMLCYCFTPYKRLWLYNGAPYDTLGIRRMYSRLKPPASSRVWGVYGRYGDLTGILLSNMK